MSANWLEIGLTAGAQHLWQSALALVFITLLLRSKASAEARALGALMAFLLAAVSPLAVLLPHDPAPASAVKLADLGHVAQPMENVPQTENTGGKATRKGLMLNPAMATNALAALWIVGLLWSLVRLAHGWCQARLMRRSATRNPELECLLGTELPHNASVAVSDTAVCPMVIGLVRPCILVPTELATSLTPSVMTNLLLHEAAHIHRRDLWISTVQRLLLGCYWWSPFMRRLGKHLDLAREMACDERAALRSGGGRAYASTLLEGASRLTAHHNAVAPLAVGMFDDRSGLAKRIDNLLGLEARLGARHKHWAWGVICLAALSSQVGLTLAATPRLGVASVPDASSDSAMADVPSAEVEQLIAAVSAGRLDEVRHLVDSGVDVDSRVRGDGTALIVASKDGQLEMVEQLLALGARPDQPSVGDGNPLIAAASGGHLRVVKRLVAAGVNVNGAVIQDETPLINASRGGHLPVVKYLVEHGADVNLGVVADQGRWRSPLNQARTDEVRAYLASKGAVAHK